MKWTITNTYTKEWQRYFAWFPRHIPIKSGDTIWIWLEYYDERLLRITGACAEFERRYGDNQGIITRCGD